MNDPSFNKYKAGRLFHATKALLILLILALPLLHAGAWFFPGEYIIAGTWRYINTAEVMNAESWQIIASYTISLPSVLLTVGSAYLLLRWIMKVQKGQLFTKSSIDHIRTAAILLLTYTPVSILQEIIISPILTWNNPVGERIVRVSLFDTEVILTFIGLILFSFYKVLQHAHNQSKELEEII